jgi:hypothetical protein
MAIRTGPVFTQLQRQLGPQLIADELLQVCDDTVDQLLGQPTESSRPGMLLGMIQSGKTKAFIGVLGLAFDNGFDHAVIFTKGTKALARQTVARLRREFRLAIEQDLLSVYDIMTLPEALSPWELGRKLAFVCKKEDDNLDALTEVLTQQYPELASRRLLLIDDEADLASIGYRRTANGIEANVIPTQMNDLRDSLTNASYLLVTATPYALYLQPEEIQIPANQQVFQPIRPAFTELVPPHGAYIGGEFYFEQSQELGTVASHLHIDVDPDELVVLRTPNSPELDLAQILTSGSIRSLRRSIVTFAVGGIIRRWQRTQAGEAPGRFSFIVHTETKNAAHTWQSEIVSELIRRLRQEAAANIAAVRPQIAEAYSDLEASVNIQGLPLPPLALVLQEFAGTLDGLGTQKVNREADVNQLLDENGQLQLRNPLNVFIGGSILDRGITIDNVIGFYYGRNPKRSQQDTVLQHARMYGARARGDLAVTRFYTTADIYSRMATIHEFDSALRVAFERGGQDQGVVFLRRDPGNQIIACSPNKILLSRVTTLRPGGRLIPVGFSTNAQTSARVADIDRLLLEANPNPTTGTYILAADTVVRLVDLIAESLTMDPGYDFDFDAMRAAVLYMTANNTVENQRGEVACLVRRGRNFPKRRPDGRLQNAPERQAEHADILPIRGNRPALFLFRVPGPVNDGWSGQSFYWPVLFAQQDVEPVIFTAEVGE